MEENLIKMVCSKNEFLLKIQAIKQKLKAEIQLKKWQF